MALDDGATLVPATGHFYIDITSAPGTATPPDDPTAPITPWVEIGHTSRENPLGISQEGGEETVLGSWQNPALRTSRTPVNRFVTFSLLQWDELAYRLYYGGNGAVDVPSGYFRAPLNPVPLEGALFARLDDGVEQVGIFSPRSSFIRAEDVEMDPENLSGHPIRGTLLGVSGNDWLFGITPKGALAAS